MVADSMKTIVEDAILSIAIPGFLQQPGIWEIEKKYRKSVSDGVAAFTEQARMKKQRSTVQAILAATSFTLGGLIMGLYGLFR